MKAVAVTGIIMYRKTENRPKYGFKKVNCKIQGITNVTETCM